MKDFLDALVYMFRASLCDIGFHQLEYYMEEHKCTGLKRLESINIRMKECSCCGKKWMHPSPAVNGELYHWEQTDMKEDEVLKFTEI